MAAANSGGDWKHKSGSAKPAATPAVGTSRKAWQPGAAKPKGPAKPRSRGSKLIVAGLVSGVLIALIVVVIILLKPSKFPDLVVVAPAPGDALALPFNGAGTQTATALGDWAKAGTDRPTLAASPDELANAEAWKAKLTGKNASTVLYFAAAGGADAEGPFLWFVDPAATAPADGQKVRVKDVLARLGGLKPDHPKLLVFDLARSPVSGPHGQFFPDFARALRELDGEIAKVENLVVICSCDADETAWSSEELRETVFGHFFRAGLQGAAASSDGDAITAAKLFEYAKEQTSKWASVNRDEKQTPFLLPTAGGMDRAANDKARLATKLGSKPAEALGAPLHDPEKSFPKELDELWKKADALAARAPLPDTTDPAKWREFLETLLRWEQAIRFGRGTGALQAKAQSLGDQLSAAAGVEPLAVGLGLRVGPALGFPAPLPRKEFRSLWNPPPGGTRVEEYDRITGKGMNAVRLGLAAQVLDEVSKTGTADDLAAADELLGLIDGSQVGPSETHFVRMLARNLDKSKRPSEKRIQEAIKLVRLAEEAALAGAYAEQAFRWVAKDIDAGDAVRRMAEDCLFASDDAAYAEFDEKRAAATKSYERALDMAGVVARALEQRDRAFARLPYYGRWAAGYRGQLPAADVKALMGKVEEAARLAHEIAAVLAMAGPQEAKGAVDELRDKTAALKASVAAIEAAFAADAGQLSNTVSQQNWHAIDGVLSVPFLKAEDRAKLYGYHRAISYTLAGQQQQPTGSGLQQLSPQESANRALRIGKALVNDSSPQLQALLEQPNPSAWWLSFRQAAETLGKDFRALPEEMAQLGLQAAAKPQLVAAVPEMAKASYKARLADPAAPCTLAEAPTATEQRYWQHRLLLNQARRATGDGWADVGPGPPAAWYCRTAAANYIASALAKVTGGAPLAPPAAARLGAECAAESARQPAELTVKAAAAREIADEPKWTYPVTVERAKDTAVGYPVYWLTEPGEPYHAPAKAGLGRQRIVAFATGDAESTKITREFSAPAKAVETTVPGKLATTVLYRGHRYETTTKIILAGTPTVDIHQAPAKGPARFAVLSEPETVAGAVTIMIDLTKSMSDVIVLNRTRIEEAILGVERLLKAIPKGTTVTIGSFYGNADRTRIETDIVHDQIKLDVPEQQIEGIMKVVRRVKLVGDSTPLAGAIREVVSADRGKKFWPKVFTGTRTLIVVTDGEDNWAQKGKPNYYKPKDSPADITINALRDATDDVALHLVFFGLVTQAQKNEENDAYEQFEPISYPEQFRKSKRTPAKLYRGVRDSKEFADLLVGAMTPTIPYTDQNTRGDNERRVPITIVKDATYTLSEPLKPGTYHLWAGASPQKLQLDAGDRVLLKATANNEGRLELGIPPIAYSLAGRSLTVPRATAPPAPGDRTPLRMTLPAFDLTHGTNTCDLTFIATLEANDGEARNILYRQPPLFAWFEPRYADGKPADPEYKTSVRIDNRPGLFAPAWTLKLDRWDADRSPDAIRKPTITGHWIERLPPDGLPISVDMRNVPGAKEKLPPTSNVQGINVEIESIGLEQWQEGDKHPDGQYLTVRLKYPNAASKVFLRPGKLGGTNQAATLHERHTYYDSVGRYTARFGPISKDDETVSTDLMLYSVGELRKAADDSGRSVTVAFPDRPMVRYAMPDFLQPK